MVGNSNRVDDLFGVRVEGRRAADRTERKGRQTCAWTSFRRGAVVLAVVEWSAGCFQPRLLLLGIVDQPRCEYRFSLGVAVNLPGQHAQLILFEPEVVKAFARKVVVDGPLADSADPRRGRWTWTKTGSSSGKARRCSGRL